MSKKKGRRPYKSPVVRTEKVYERKGLACAKNDGSISACLSNFKLS
jgi:hypothetical protein